MVAMAEHRTKVECSSCHYGWVLIEMPPSPEGTAQGSPLECIQCGGSDLTIVAPTTADEVLP